MPAQMDPAPSGLSLLCGSQPSAAAAVLASWTAHYSQPVLYCSTLTRHVPDGSDVRSANWRVSSLERDLASLATELLQDVADNLCLYVECLNPFLLHQSTCSLVCQLNQLLSHPRVTAIVAVLCTDIVSTSAVNQLNYLANCTVRLHFDPFLQKHTARHTQLLPSGKFSTKWYTYAVEPDARRIRDVQPLDRLKALQGSLAAPSGQQQQPNEDAPPGSSFKIGLSDGERAQRDQLTLPHQRSQMEYAGRVKVGGQVIYEADDGDDHDEEDPDDDLNI